MDRRNTNEPANLNTQPGLNQSPTGPSFRSQGPQGVQSTKLLGFKLVLTVIAAVIGFVLIRVIF